MRFREKFIMTLCLTLLLSATVAMAQTKGMKSITPEELKTHLTFIASDELQGRNTPSPGQKIAARYIATHVESYGFKPMMEDGSFLQKIPMMISTVSPEKTKLTINTDIGDLSFSFPQAFGGRFTSGGFFEGEAAFVGFGLDMKDKGWDDYGNAEYEGKVVIMLGGNLPSGHEFLEGGRSARRKVSGRARSSAARTKGATAVLTIIEPDREDFMKQGGFTFGNEQVGQYPESESSSSVSSFASAEIRHDVAAAILGISTQDIRKMFEQIANGKQASGIELEKRSVSLSVGLDRVKGHTQNVVAILEGKDKKLKNEYVLFGAHYDHVGAREGKIWNGADDDGSGTVGLLEIAQAFSIDRPKRSIVMVWHTGEEKGLWGAKYYTSNPTVPFDKMSVQINMDMISRNDPNTVHVIGSGRISSELKDIVFAQNKRRIKLNLDETYDAPDDPNSFYTRSDHYMYAQYGVPIVFFFTDVHDDYHQPTDTIEKVNFIKASKISRLGFLIGYDIANRKSMLKLDADPEITSRGKHNLKGGQKER